MGNLIPAFFLFLLLGPLGETAAWAKDCTIEVPVEGAIGPAVLDFVERAKSRAEKNNCGNILMLLNTPGGNLQTTRLIVEEILNSPVPFLCLVHPSGGHAGSAGAIILQACHVAGGVSATNIGAATPVAGTGEKLPEDLRNKLINDTVSWVEGLARLRGRNVQFAKDIVVEAKSVSAEEAVKIKAMEFAGATKQDFIAFVDGRTVQLDEKTTTKIAIGEVLPFQQDLRYRVMALLTDPQVAYLIFMGSLGLLYYELTHPGMFVPGVVGAVGLVISLISLHMLDVTWGAAILIILGIAFMIAEAFVSGFGILGLGGIVAFFVGSLFLFDPETTGYSLPLSTILPTTIVLGAAMLGIAYLAYKAHRRRRGGFAGLIGKTGKITEVQPGDGRYGFMEVEGELWRCTSNVPMRVGDQAVVKSHTGLTLQVEIQNGEHQNRS